MASSDIQSSPAIAAPSAAPSASAAPTTVAAAAPSSNGTKLYRERLSVLPTSTATVVDYYVTGGAYGHPALFAALYSSASMTHGAYYKIAVDDATNGAKQLLPDVTPGLKYIHSDCYHIPKALLEKDVAKQGDGDSGVRVYHFGKIHTRPGSYIILSAAERIAMSVIREIVEEMGKGSDGKAVTKRVLTEKHLAGMFARPTSPIMALAAAFYAKWRGDVVPRTVQSGRTKIVTKTIYPPMPIEWKRIEIGMGLTATDKFIIDNIVATRMREKQLVGHRLQESLVKSGKVAERAKLAEAAATKRELEKVKRELEKAKAEAEGKRSRKIAAPEKSELEREVEADRKKSRDGAADGKTIRITDPSYRIETHLSHKRFVRDAIDRMFGDINPVAKIEPLVKRFFDDFINRLLVTMAENAVQCMGLVASTTLSTEIAMLVVGAFMTSVGLSTQSGVHREVLDAAASMRSAIETTIDKAKTQRKLTKTARAVIAAGPVVAAAPAAVLPTAPSSAAPVAPAPAPVAVEAAE